MSLKRLAAVALAVCCGLALLSVAAESFRWWGTDAGRSWTAVVLGGYAVLLVQGGLRRPWRRAVPV